MPYFFSKDYFKQVLIACDQVANTLFCGWADETISSRMYREQRKIMMSFIDMMFFWEPNHCYKSYLSELNKSHFPVTMRNIQSQFIKDQEKF